MPATRCLASISSGYSQTLTGVASGPGGYAFGGGDNAVHVFTGGVIYNTAGPPSITVPDTVINDDIIISYTLPPNQGALFARLKVTCTTP